MSLRIDHLVPADSSGMDLTTDMCDDPVLVLYGDLSPYEPTWQAVFDSIAPRRGNNVREISRLLMDDPDR